MNFATRLLVIGVMYGLGIMFIKSLFPEPFILLLFQTGESSEGNLTLVSLVYILSGFFGSLIAVPLFGAFLLFRRRSGASDDASGTSYGPRFVLSIAFALLGGFFSGVLVLIAYGTGLLPAGGVLDPLKIIGASNFPSGTPLLVAWSIARDLLPAGLAGLFLAPIGGDMLQKLYAPHSGPLQKEYDWGD